jgi:hypothetical protein
MFQVKVRDTGEHADLLASHTLLLPWAGESVGQDFAPYWRLRAGLEPPRKWVYAGGSRRPDPGGRGVVGSKSRCSLECFPLEHDGTSLVYPLLASITSLAITRFSGEQLPALVEEIDRLVPDLTPDDAVAFVGVAFMAEEVIRVGRGHIEITPL